MRQSKAPEAHKEFMQKAERAADKGKKLKVSKLPRREMVIFFYEKKGYKVVPGRSSKYVTMEKPGVENKYFIGNKGGVQYGDKISDAFSIAINYAALERWMNAYLNGKKESQ